MAEPKLKIGMSGTHCGMTRQQQIQVFRLLSKNASYENKYNEFHHGDCIGADIEAAAIAHSLGYYIVCHPPVNSYRRGLFQYNDYIYLSYPYVERDIHIVNQTDMLVAAPHTSYEIIRSGTWETVRYARQLNRRIYIIKPNGDIQEENQSD